MIAILVILSITITYKMTLLFLIAFVYILFAYQNHLNKKAIQGESSESKVPLAQPSNESNVPTQVRAESFEPTIFLDSEVKAKPLDSVTTNEEQQSLNGLSSSNQEISSPGKENSTIKNLGESKSIHGEDRNVSALNEVLAPQFEREGGGNYSQIPESRQEELVDLSSGETETLQEEENEEISSGEAETLQEEENEEINSNAELLEKESNDDRFK